VLGLAGTDEEVAWQTQAAEKLGFRDHTSLDYDREFWSGPGPVRRISILPSRLAEQLASLQPENFVARAGNGTIFYRGGSEPPKASIPMSLTRRVKEIFDQKNILPDLPL
jgi:hypothetical protein